MDFVAVGYGGLVGEGFLIVIRDLLEPAGKHHGDCILERIVLLSMGQRSSSE